MAQIPNATDAAEQKLKRKDYKKDHLRKLRVELVDENIVSPRAFAVRADGPVLNDELLTMLSDKSEGWAARQ